MADPSATSEAGAPESRGGVPFSFPARVGALLVAPRRGLAAADHPEAGGRAVTDLVALLGLTVLALHTPAVVTALWIAASGELGGGLSSLVAAVSQAVAGELSVLLILGLAITLLAGRRRSLARDLDLACAAVAPALALKAAVALTVTVADARPPAGVSDGLAYLGYGWAGALAVLAVLQARSRPDEEPSDPLRARSGWRRAGWAALGVWGAVIAVEGSRIASDLDEVRPVVSGDRAPAFELPVISEGGEAGPATAALADYEGDVVVLEFWATWCGPCRQSLPTLERIRERYEDHSVEVIAINTEGPGHAPQAQAMLDDLDFGGVSLSDTGRTSRLYRVTTIPHLAVVGPEGTIELVHRGFPGASRYESIVTGEIDDLLGL